MENLTIEDLKYKIPTKIYNSLIYYLGQGCNIMEFTTYREEDLMRLRGIGPNGVRQIKRALSSLGVALFPSNNTLEPTVKEIYTQILTELREIKMYLKNKE